MRNLRRREFLATSLGLAAQFGLRPQSLWASVGAPAARRLLYIYVPNGVWLPAFRPSQVGPLGELPQSLSPLEPYRDRLTVLSGLSLNTARANGDGPGDHARAAASFLTGVQAKKSDGAVLLGPSADQILLRGLAKQQPQVGLHLGCEAALSAGQCDSGYACAYSSHISWRDAHQPAPKETDPQVVFDQLFRGGSAGVSRLMIAQRDARRAALLETLKRQTKELINQVGSAAALQAEQYWSALQAFETELHKTTPGADVPDAARPESPGNDYDRRARQLMDVLALALASDRTRVATLMLGNEGSNRPYPNLNESEGHHSLSHYGEDADKHARIARINRYHIELLAYLLDRLAAFSEGGKTLLDQVQIVYGSGIADGNAHDHGDLPILLLNPITSSTVAPPTGRHLRWPQETPLNDLHLWLLAQFGVKPQRFGDGRRPLDWGQAEGV
jgi:Protein of unknown function (DUF1552)